MNLNLLHNAMLFGVQSQYDRLFHVFIIYIFDDFQFISLSCIIPFRLVPLLFSQIGAVDPAFRLMRFPLDGELDFYFEKLILFD